MMKIDLQLFRLYQWLMRCLWGRGLFKSKEDQDILNQVIMKVARDNLNSIWKCRSTRVFKNFKFFLLKNYFYIYFESF